MVVNLGTRKKAYREMFRKRTLPVYQIDQLNAIGFEWSTHRAFLPFKEARVFVRNLGLKTRKQWIYYCRSKKVKNIPTWPNAVYKNEWISFGDWLGVDVIAYLPFFDARCIVRQLGLKNIREWRRYVKSGKKPDTISSTPYKLKLYQNDWVSWDDWFGKNYDKRN
jgi:hypothetical protein